MYKKIFILSPAGGNINYIALTLLGKIVESQLAYHDQGTHGHNAHLIKHQSFWDHSFQVYLDDKDFLPIQVVTEEKFYFLIINWWEKLYFHVNNNNDLLIWAQQWLSDQGERWKEYEQPFVRANLNWFYAYKDRIRPEMFDCPQIKNKFNFDFFYTSYESLGDQFRKYGIKYTKQQYESWKTSQQLIFESYREISHKSINQLTKDYQKSIAIGLLGVKNNLTEEECWKEFKSKLVN